MRPRFSAAAFVLVLLALAVPAVATAQERPAQAGEVDIVLRYSDLVLNPGDIHAELEASLINRTNERVRFQLEILGAPDGWDVVLWELFSDFRINEWALEPGDFNEILIFVNPPPEAPAGTHEMMVRATSSDGTLVAEQSFTVITTETVALVGPGVSIASTFPVQEGAPSDTFEFNIIVTNLTADQASFSLVAATPDNWEISFLPRSDTSKVISSVSLNANGSQRLLARLSPPRQALAGTYPIRIAAFNEDSADDLAVRVVLTGQGELRVSMEDERLDLSATAGKDKHTVFRVTNIGTGPLENASLLADAPERWLVEFEPESIDLLPPGETLDVDVTITPADDTIPGDYRMSLIALNPQSGASVDLIVDVGQSTLWRWFGLGLVVIVVAGLVGIYARLSRRAR